MVDKIWYNMEELIGGSEERVLIETYWNVNTDISNNIIAILRINRNILECKSPYYHNRDCCQLVLIETYWNVNVTYLM